MGVGELFPCLCVCLLPVAIPEPVPRVTAGHHQILAAHDPAGPLGHGRVASLCVLRYFGRVDELAGLSLRRGCGFGEDILGLRFVHHRAPPIGNGLVRNGVNLKSLSYNIGTVHLSLSTHILFTPRA